VKPTIAPATPRANRLAGLFEPATVVLFAGLGGVCIGVEQAYVDGGHRDKYIDLCVNHWETAVGVHELNHPMTRHLHADVLEVDPAAVLPGRKIAYLHASPDCTDFSKAKGGKPKRKHIRALADVVLVWAGKRRPDVITLENVEEFKDWGPLNSHGQPDKARRGEEFNRWVGELRALGYAVEWRELRACDYGTPTTRKRLFVIARCDGKPIIWPEKTHGAVGSKESVASAGVHGVPSSSTQRDRRSARGRVIPLAFGADCDLRDSGSDDRPRTNADTRHGQRHLAPYRTAAGCIDWRQPMLSIFATRPDAREWSKAVNVGRERFDRVGIPQRPLKPKTQKRIAGGLLKWVLGAAEPFIVNIENYGWDSSPGQSVDRPLSTVTAGPRGGKHAAVDVELAAYTGTFNHGGHDFRTNDVRTPLGTVTGARDARGVIGVELAPFTTPRHGERDGQTPRSRSIARPLPTITGTDNGAQLVAVALNKHFGGVVGQPADVPAGTITGIDHHSLLAVSLANYHGEKNGESRSQRADEPIRTLDTQNRFGLVAAHVVKFRGESPGTSAAEPLDTITAGSHQSRPAGAGHAMGVACCYLSHMYTSNTCGGQGDPRKPLKTITSGGQHAKVCAVYLTPFYGEGSGLTGHPAALDRAKQVARWARRMLGSKVDKHLLWVSDAETGKRFPLLMLALRGAVHIVTDIAMRMLRPRELARAQGFPSWYVIDRTADGQPVSKADQVKLIGNSVPPQLARAIAKANVVDLGVLRDSREAVSA
jgi:DNA (cytosine-5)-methyltransferase 1